MGLQSTHAGPVTVLTINRPDRANAIDLDTALDLSTTLEQLAEDPAVRVVVLTGAGERAFCAGINLGAVRAGLAPQINAVPGGFAGIVRRSFPKPVVAAAIAARPAAAVDASVALARQVARGDESDAWRRKDELAARVAAAQAR
jgi:hypothetical protein